MSDLNMGGNTPTPAPSAPAAAPAAAPSAPAAAPSTTSAPASPATGGKEVSEAEGRKDPNPRTESYTDKGPLTKDSWLEKVAKHKKSGKTTPKVAPSAPPPAAAPVLENEPKNTVQEVKIGSEEPAAEETEGGELGNAEPAAEFKPNPKFTAVGKEYELPKYLTDAIQTPEQEKEVKELYTKAMGLDHVKQRHQELVGKYTEVEKTHNEVVEGITELKEIYREAVTTKNPLLLTEFFDKLQIPPAVVLQYAQAVQEYVNLDAAQKQVVDGNIEAQRRARDLGKQNQRLSQTNFQGEVSARAQALDTALARPELSPAVQKFEAQFGPGSFKAELIRNGVYVFQTEKRDLSLAENVNQVIQRFGLNAAPAPGQAPAAPQAQPVAPQAPAAQPPAAPQGQPPVIPSAHRKGPTIPGVNGKASSPTKQKPGSIADLKALRKAKFGS